MLTVASLAERLRKLDVLFNNGRPVFVVPATIWPELCAVVEAAEGLEAPAKFPASADARVQAFRSALADLARRMDEEGL